MSPSMKDTPLLIKGSVCLSPVLLSAQIQRKHTVPFPGIKSKAVQYPQTFQIYTFIVDQRGPLVTKLQSACVFDLLKPHPSSASFSLLFITAALVVPAHCTAALPSLLPKLTLKCLLGPDVFHVFHPLFSSPPPSFPRQVKIYLLDPSDPILKYPLINLSSLVLFFPP